MAAKKGAKGAVVSAGVDVALATTELMAGTYYGYSVDASGNISAKSINAVTITDGTNPIVTMAAQNVTDAVGQTISIASNEGTGLVYIIRDGEPQGTVTDFEAAVSAKKGAKGTVVTPGVNIALSTTGLVAGTYQGYAVDEAGLISAASTNVITITDATPPVATMATQNVTDAVGQTVNIASNESTGYVYLIKDGEPQNTVTDFEAAVSAKKGAKGTVVAAGVDVSLSTTGLAAGTYYGYAVDAAGNISLKSTNAVTITDVTPPVPTFNPADGANNVPINTNITITFNEPIRHLDNTEITDADLSALITFCETDSNGASVDATITIDGSKKVITINPVEDLDYLQQYYVEISPVEDAYNNAIVPTNITFTTAAQYVPVPPPPQSGGSGSGSGSSITTTQYESPITNPITAGDNELNASIKKTNQATINMIGDADDTTEISAGTLREIAQSDRAINIEGNGYTLTLSVTTLNGISNNLANNLLQISAREITDTEKEQILADANLGQSTGLFTIGGRLYDFSANILNQAKGTTKRITSFSEPVEVVLDLSDLNLTSEQIAKLCGTRLEKNTQGNIVPVALGGTYNPNSKAFTFYTDKFSQYTVLQNSNLMTLQLTIGNQLTYINGKPRGIDVPPSLINNRTMVPLRFIGEALGASFEWNEQTRTVTYKTGTKEITLVIDKPIAGFDTPATIVKGRTMVPLRYISEIFGSYVMWFPSSNKVIVTK